MPFPRPAAFSRPPFHGGGSRATRGFFTKTTLDPNLADIWSRAKRSEVMARIGGGNTSPEQAFRAALRKAGINYSSATRLLGRPDVVLRSSRTAIFVHGCFWHGCPDHYRAPSSRVSYWSRKLQINLARDRRVTRQLRREGWSVLVVWECRIKRDPDKAAERIRKYLNRRPRPSGPSRRTN